MKPRGRKDPCLPQIFSSVPGRLVKLISSILAKLFPCLLFTDMGSTGDLVIAGTVFITFLVDSQFKIKLLETFASFTPFNFLNPFRIEIWKDLETQLIRLRLYSLIAVFAIRNKTSYRDLKQVLRRGFAA